MSLLDSDSEIIKRNNEQSGSKKSGRKAKKSGLNRFANSLNKYKHLSEQHKENLGSKDAEETGTESQKTTPVKNETINETTAPVSRSEVLKDDPKQTVSRKTQPLRNAPEKPAEIQTFSKDHEPAELEYELDNKKSTEKATLEYELDNKKSTEKATLEYELDNKKSTEKATLEYELDNNKSTTGVHKGLQIGVHGSPDLPLVRLLSGQKRQLLNLFFDDCRSQGSLSTGRLLNEHLSKALDVKPSTLKTLVYRLSKDGFIERMPGKRGRGGWIQIMIPKPIYNQLMTITSLNTVEMISQNIEYKMSTEKGTQRSTNPPSSSSSILENQTTTTRELPETWKIIQIPQNLKDIGISTAHIFQIANDGYLGPDEVQDSLEAFSYDLGQGSVNAKFGPLRLLLGVLRKQKVPYVSQAMIEQERQQLEEYMIKKEAAEAVKKQQAELGLIKKFEDWWNGLSSNQRNEIAPANKFFEEGSQMQKTVARGMFLENPDSFVG